MDSDIRSHALSLALDDETWAELKRVAASRGETTAELVVLAVERYLEAAGFTPEWATIPLDARFPC